MDLGYHHILKITYHYQSLEVKNNGKHGLKILMIGQINRQKQLKQEFHIIQLFKLKMTFIYIDI